MQQSAAKTSQEWTRRAELTWKIRIHWTNPLAIHSELKWAIEKGEYKSQNQKEPWFDLGYNNNSTNLLVIERELKYTIKHGKDKIQYKQYMQLWYTAWKITELTS